MTTMPSRQCTGKTYFGQSCIRNFTSVTLYGYKTTWNIYNIFFHNTQINLFRVFLVKFCQKFEDENLLPKAFRPEWSFVKSIPDRISVFFHLLNFQLRLVSIPGIEGHTLLTQAVVALSLY
jgi:hypothetical protein